MIWHIGAFFGVLVVVLALRRIGGASRSATPSQSEIQRLIAADEILTAARMYRELTGLGLRDSKRAVERIKATGAWEAPLSSTAPIEGDAGILALIEENKLIEAIKLYRDEHRVDLAAAKAAVDRIAERRGKR